MNSRHISLEEFTTKDNLQSEDVLENRSCISITDICQKNVVLSDKWLDTLSIKFYDTDIKSHPQSLNKEQALQIIKYMQKVYNSDCKELIIHCHAGISRSRALHNFYQYYIVKNQYIIDNPPQFIGNAYVYSLLVETFYSLQKEA